jgi:linoleate 8R-lipoxygenase/9,12-octadecadienoate 8-hydroperoxide 8R-isomerase
MIDYTPKNLTNWGFNEVKYDNNIDQGHVLYKLLLRAFPHHIKPDSVYAHFPLVIPRENETILKALDINARYTWDRPAFMPGPTVITSYDAIAAIMNNKADFKVTWGKAIKFLMRNDGKEYGADFMLSGDLEVHQNSRDMMHKALHARNWEQEIRNFYEKVTLRLLHEKSYKVAGVNQVDVVRDIGNLASVHFAAHVFLYPLKTEENPRGVYTEREMYTILACKAPHPF